MTTEESRREAVGRYADQAREAMEDSTPRSPQALYNHGLAEGAEAALAILDGRHVVPQDRT